MSNDTNTSAAPAPFSRFRDGQPPTAGLFATDRSVDVAGTPVRIGDIITDAVNQVRGVTIGIYGSTFVYLVDQPDDDGGMNYMQTCEANDARIIGHAYNVLQEIARIETADAEARQTKAT